MPDEQQQQDEPRWLAPSLRAEQPLPSPSPGTHLRASWTGREIWSDQPPGSADVATAGNARTSAHR
jgi:hypothetical protein